MAGTLRLFLVWSCSLCACQPLRLLVFDDEDALGLEFVRTSSRQLGANLTVVSPLVDTWGTQPALEEIAVRHVRCERDLKSCDLQFAHDQYDAVVDFSAASARDVLAASALISTRHYVLASSSLVYTPQMGSNVFSEDDAPSMSDFTNFDRLSSSKETLSQLEEEEALWRASQGSFCATVLRLPAVLGPRDSSNRLAQLVLMIEIEDVPLSPSSRQKVSFVDAASVASAAVRIVERVAKSDPCCCGVTFNVAQPPVSFEELLRMVANATNATLTTTASLLPPTFAEKAYSHVQYAALFSAELNTSRLAALGWAPAQPLQRAVEEASRFIHTELLEKRVYGPQREALVARLPLSIAASPQGVKVLRDYDLTVPFAEPEGWPRPNRAGQAKLPLSYAVVPLTAFLVRFLPARHWEPVTFTVLFGWWACVCVTGSLTSTTMEVAFWVREWFGFSPPFWMAIFSELGLGVLSLGFCIWAMCSREGAHFEREATAAVRGVGPRSVLFAIRTTVVFFLLGHKISLRFHGDGLGGEPRPHIEFTWPILVITHEAFLTWTDAFMVFSTYGLFTLAVCRALHAVFGQVLAVGSPFSVLAFSLPTFLAVMVSVFETHHVLEEAKLLKFAGTTGCIWISLVWLLFVPSFLLLWLCRTPSLLCCRTGADAIDGGGGLPVKGKSEKMHHRNSDDREALVGSHETSHVRSRNGLAKSVDGLDDAPDVDDV
ncbi:hypothetical protein AB1Y20_023071 [Prymnesium parvum]|uniref:Uncharacterized protein n=1 Tax=Prymnesium parvum TaxID=97485 RepID=A0AB34JFM3_PRYPA